jgi:hypothetical protein
VEREEFLLLQHTGVIFNRLNLFTPMKPTVSSGVGVALILIALTCGAPFGSELKAQSNGAYDFPSDVAQLPYDVSEMVQLIRVALEAPEAHNTYVQLVLLEQDFPSLSLGAPCSKKQLKDLTEWVETHPAAIERLLIARKKNHDFYHNPTNAGSSN